MNKGRLEAFSDGVIAITANTDQTRHKSNKLKVLSRKDYIWQHIR
jgi:hypothetical protein